jgi:CheY-like chemotaxis protein
MRSCPVLRINKKSETRHISRNIYEGRGLEDAVRYSSSSSILLLDDELDIVALLKTALQRTGYNVFGLSYPIAALEHFKLNPENYVLIISDLRMPVINGFEFITNIRQSSPKIKILLMTAFDVNGDSEFDLHFNA